MPVAVLAPKRGYVKIGKEAVARGTAAAAMVSLATESTTLRGRFNKPTPNRVDNSIHEVAAPVQTRRHSDGDVAGNVLIDSIGYLLMAIFGTDTITGSNPYTHKFTFATLPPSYTFERNRGGLAGASNSMQFLNMVCSKLTISAKVDQDDAFLKFAASFIGKAPTLITASAWTDPTVREIPAADTAFTTYGGGAGPTDVLTDYSVTFERVAAPVKGANNSLDISDAVSTLVKVSGMFERYFLDYTMYADFVATTERALQITTALDANNSLGLVIPKAYLVEEEPVEGETFIKQKFNFKGIYDPTAGTLGAAYASLVNAVTPAY